MSWLKYVFDSDWSQRADIEALRGRQERRARSLSARARRTGRRVGELGERVGDLEEQVGTLSLYLVAAIDMLRRHELWDEDEFAATLDRIDAADGEADGKTRIG